MDEYRLGLETCLVSNPSASSLLSHQIPQSLSLDLVVNLYHLSKLVIHLCLFLALLLFAYLYGTYVCVSTDIISRKYAQASSIFSILSSLSQY